MSSASQCFAIQDIELLGGTKCKRIINGLWQTASNAWGVETSQFNHDAIARELAELARLGFTSFDGADIYGASEILMGKTKNMLQGVVNEDGEEIKIQTLTKFVPSPVRQSRKMVEDSITKSSSRMQEDNVHLIQFHWWDYTLEDEMLEAVHHLDNLRIEGKIKSVGLTNMDTQRMRLFVDQGLQVNYLLIFMHVLLSSVLKGFVFFYFLVDFIESSTVFSNRHAAVCSNGTICRRAWHLLANIRHAARWIAF